MNEFNDQNTDGYTQIQLDSLNSEWECIVENNNIELDSDEYYNECKRFSDLVSKR